MSSSAITTQVAQLKISSIQNQADSSGVYSAGVWSFKNSTAVASVTISDAGNVGIGTASPSNRLHIYQNSVTNITAKIENATSNAGNLIQFSQVTSGAVASPLAYVGHGGDNTGDFVLLNASNTAMKFSTNGTERMRIEASGNFLVGTTSAVNNTHQLQGTTNPAGTPVLYVRKPAVSLNNSGNSYVEFLASGGGFEGYIGVSGTTLQVVDASDSRKKENVRPANYGLKEIKELKPVVYDWKEEFGGEKDVKGFLAQEVKQVLPECVTTQDESERGGFSDSHFLGTASMIPVLVAAIQEQQAQIESLKAEVAALKAP